MTIAPRAAFATLACALIAACGTSTREPVPITPPADVATAPVVRVPVPPAAGVPATPPIAVVPPQRLDPSTFPAGAVYVCASGEGAQRKLTAVEFDAKVGSLCRRHPEMGPCQYERSICRRSGGRVYATDGSEITQATEAEYDRKVMRVRLRSN